MTPRRDHPKKRALPAAVVALGWVSLLTHTPSDKVYPLVPAFLLSIGGGAMALGWLEGVAESVAAALKIVAGRASDRAARRRPLIAWGYTISALARPFYALAWSPVHAVLVRTADRVGKGLRGPPRDAMLAAATTADQRGHAFGFHRMMDNLGAVLGALLAFALLGWAGLEVREIFVISAVPGLAAVAVILLLVKEPRPAAPAVTAEPPATTPTTGSARTPAPAPAKPAADDAPPTHLPRAARRYLVAVAVFSLASSGDLFLMRRLTDLGLDVTLVPIAWVSLQLMKGLTNVPGGRLSDRLGRRTVLGAAWVVYAASYLGFAWVSSWPAAWALLALYAVHYGLAEGGQRALLAEYAPERARGRAYGWQLGIEGGLALPANVAFGFVYDRLGAATAFGATAGVALLAACVLALFVPSPRAAAA
ncbi:MAG: MFS transporter [Polyangiaceae bacterium]